MPVPWALNLGLGTGPMVVEWRDIMGLFSGQFDLAGRQMDFADVAARHVDFADLGGRHDDAIDVSGREDDACDLPGRYGG